MAYLGMGLEETELAKSMAAAIKAVEVYIMSVLKFNEGSRSYSTIVSNERYKGK